MLRFVTLAALTAVVLCGDLTEVKMMLTAPDGQKVPVYDDDLERLHAVMEVCLAI